MKKLMLNLVLLAILNCCAIAAFAENRMLVEAELEGVKADVIEQLNDAAKKFIALAEAVPEDKYGWRPGKGVRSIGEVFNHVAAANFGLPTFVGVKFEGALGREAFQKMGAMEKTSGKAKIVAQLKKSFEYARNAINGVKVADLDKKVKFFGGEKTFRGILMLIATHCHEHLGQSIAYARTNHITPPWSVRTGM